MHQRVTKLFVGDFRCDLLGSCPRLRNYVIFARQRCNGQEYQNFCTQGGCMMKISERNRRRASRYLAAAAPVAIGLFAASPAVASSTCSQLTNLHRPNTTITTAQTVPAGTFVTPTTPPQSYTGLPQFCRVAGFTTPTSDSHIDFEVWLPEAGWNLKYLQAGCGGFCGSISYG